MEVFLLKNWKNSDTGKILKAGTKVGLLKRKAEDLIKKGIAGTGKDFENLPEKNVKARSKKS